MTSDIIYSASITLREDADGETTLVIEYDPDLPDDTPIEDVPFCYKVINTITDKILKPMTSGEPEVDYYQKPGTVN